MFKKEGIPLEQINFIDHTHETNSLISGKVDIMSTYPRVIEI